MSTYRREHLNMHVEKKSHVNMEHLFLMTLRQKVAWFKQNFPEDEEDPADGLPSMSLGVKILNRCSWQDVCTSEDADGSEDKPISRAQFYAFVNPNVLKDGVVHVKIELRETLRTFKKRI